MTITGAFYRDYKLLGFVSNRDESGCFLILIHSTLTFDEKAYIMFFGNYNERKPYRRL